MRDVVVLDCGIWIKFYLGVYVNKRTLFLEKLCWYGKLSWSFIAWLSAIFIKCLFWKNYVLGSEVIKCMNILGSIDFSFPISEPWLLSSPRRREISSCLNMSSGRVMNHIHLYHLPTFGWINCQHTDCATALVTSKTFLGQFRFWMGIIWVAGWSGLAILIPKHIWKS